MLSSQGAAESARIKSSIKSFFRKRFCFNAVTGNKGQYHRMIEFIQQATTTKTTFNISLTGPILCSMLQSYVSKLSKKTPAVIQSAFNRAVATEARKNIERLYVRYLEQMTELESKLPCSEEELWMTHSSQVLELTSRFDRSMAEFTECPEILQEKKTVVHRMASFYEELKEANYKQSEEKSRKAFLCFFEPIRKNDEFLENVVEKKLEIIEGFQEFLSQTAGPAALKVFIEESSQVVSFLFGVIENLLKFNENCREDLENQVEELKKNREKTRINEQKMQKMFENSVKELESRLADKEVAFNDMQTTYNQKLTLTEAKVKNLTREIKAKDQEIEHLHLEKEAVLEMERNLFARKEEELEEIIEKLKEKINTLENEGEKKQLRLEQSISEKDEEIQELRQKEKFSESATESIQDYSMLSGLRRDISEMFILLETEQNNNSRFVALMDRIAALQAELNKCRLKEIENRNRLIEEYDEKIYALKDELEKVSQELNESKTGMIRKSEDVAPKIDDVVKSLEGEVKLKVEQNNLLAEMIRKRDEQIESLYQVIETHKKQFEGLELDFDDKETQMKKIKSELIQIRDDNDVLIGLMGYSLEVLQKKRNIQAISLAQIGSVSNRARVIKIFKKFGIPFEQ
jgi:DNA repair exonuclease SbcCD ATPase subunit